MTPLAVAVLSGAAWFAAFLLAHIASAHIAGASRHGRAIVRTFALSVLGCSATVAALHQSWWQGEGWAWLLAEGSGVLFMLCAFVLYVPFVYVIASSLSVNTLLVLERAGGRLPRAELYRRFVAESAVRRRLDIMRRNGLLAAEDGRYRLTPKAAMLARSFAAVKRFWKLWPGG